ncbi:factor of DNA methylation 1-like [Gossypium australe]|uniref:Factor of DNA methylation 1-like n=1 Tax=Gossypium australe TaxID=47621 RepID=A0A5B6WJ64_9ROSI|nr:factor of DNA methylation 1-like [Gossypium australe]
MVMTCPMDIEQCGLYLIQQKEYVTCRDLVELEKTTSEQIAALKEQLEETSEALKDMESRYSARSTYSELGMKVLNRRLLWFLICRV